MLQHIMKLASDNGMRQFEVLEQVTTNVANVNTSGYKAKRFEQYLTPDGRLDGIQRTDFSQGSILVTQRDLDVAIQGEGFIPVTQPDGTVAYTRDGSFAKNSEGYLVTQRGDLVGSGIKLPANYERFQILPDGTVQANMKGELAPKVLGKLELVNFANPEGLKSVGYNKLVATDAAGKPTPVNNPAAFKQGNLERANVNVFQQIDQILRLNASVISNLRVVRFSDEIYRQAVNLKQ